MNSVGITANVILMQLEPPYPTWYNTDMENGPEDQLPRAHLPPQPEAAPYGPETLDATLEALLPELVELNSSPELSEATMAILTALREEPSGSPRLKMVWIEYMKIAEDIVDGASKDIEERARYQFAAMLHTALILREAKVTPRYIAAIDDAETYAHDKGLDDMAALLNEELVAAVNNAPELYPESLIAKLRLTFSDSWIEELKDALDQGVSFTSFVVIIRDMFVVLGVEDPDAELARLGIRQPDQ